MYMSWMCVVKYFMLWMKIVNMALAQKINVQPIRWYEWAFDIVVYGFVLHKYTFVLNLCSPKNGFFSHEDIILYISVLYGH